MASGNPQLLSADEPGASVMMQHYGQSGGGKIFGALDGKVDNSTAGIKLPLCYLTCKAVLTTEENNSREHLPLL